MQFSVSCRRASGSAKDDSFDTVAMVLSRQRRAVESRRGCGKEAMTRSAAEANGKPSGQIHNLTPNAQSQRFSYPGRKLKHASFPTKDAAHVIWLISIWTTAKKVVGEHPRAHCPAHGT